MNYTLYYDPDSGLLIGARRADGLQVMKGGTGWADFLAWNAQQTPPFDLSDRAPLTDAERLALARTEGLMYLAYLGSPLAIAIRIADDAMTTLQNDLNERFLAVLAQFNARIVALGGTAVDLAQLDPVRIVAADMFAYVMQNPTAGDPLPPPP